MTQQERIKADAEAYAERENSAYVNDYNGYIAGATAENSKAQVLVDALEAVRRKLNWIDDSEEREIIRKAIEQWKGKESEPVKVIEYMPIHPDDARKFDCPTQFPMHLLDEAQALRNHGQSLRRLKERGGLSVREILAIVGKKPWSYYSELLWDEAIKMLNDIVITNPQK